MSTHGVEIAYSGGRISLDLGTAPVPEPATMTLLGLGLLSLAGISRKKQR